MSLLKRLVVTEWYQLSLQFHFPHSSSLRMRLTWHLIQVAEVFSKCGIIKEVFHMYYLILELIYSGYLVIMQWHLFSALLVDHIQSRTQLFMDISIFCSWNKLPSISLKHLALSSPAFFKFVIYYSKILKITNAAW